MDNNEAGFNNATGMINFHVATSRYLEAQVTVEIWQHGE
jgi:hypothetical protein